MIRTFPVLLTLLVGGAAVAAEPSKPSVVVGVELDAAVTVDTPPGATVLPRLELGVTIPAVGQRLEVFATGGYLHLSGKGTGDDPRLEGGSYAWKAVQDDGVIGGGLRVRFLPLASKFNGHVALAGAAFVHRTATSGDAGGDAFGTNVERWTSGGLLVGVGGSVRLGPGLLGLELGVAYTPWNGTLGGERAWVAVTPGLSYRFLVGPGAPRGGPAPAATARR